MSENNKNMRNKMITKDLVMHLASSLKAETSRLWTIATLEIPDDEREKLNDQVIASMQLILNDFGEDNDGLNDGEEEEDESEDEDCDCPICLGLELFKSVMGIDGEVPGTDASKTLRDLIDKLKAE